MNSSHRLCTILVLAVLTATGTIIYQSNAADTGTDKSTSFPKLINTEDPEAKLTTAADALKGMQVPDGFTVSLFASEPDVNQPIALATDDRGRLWVAENYTYAQRSTNFDDNMRDRVVILEDEDGDGEFDKRTEFWDQGRRLTSVEIGYGGVWVLDAPNLLFIPDRDGDDIPDGEPIVMLDGWDDGAVRHNIVNGLRWGPDGWLYGRHGILATSQVGAPGATADQRTSLNCSVWRFHPTKHTFEVVCEGTTNSWGMDWDENGELFFINTVIGHLWHAVPGAYFRRMYGEHFNPHVYEVIEQTADHFHWDTKEQWSDIRKLGVTKTTDEAGGGHAHSGMAIVPSGLWPKKYDNSVITVNLHGRRINRDRLVREGATYVGKHAEDFMQASDPWFRGVELHFGPNGVLYIADWSDVGECHENDGVHRTSGRIYQIRPNGEQKQPFDFGGFGTVSATNSDQLVDAFVSEQPWLTFRAIRILAERAAAGEDLTVTRQILSNDYVTSTRPVAQRLPALWALHASGGCSEKLLRKLLDDKSESIRVWAVRLLAEGGSLTPQIQTQLTKMAESDKSGLVLTYLASALNRLPYDQRWPIAEQLVKHGEFAGDRVFPLMVWYGIEPALVSSPKSAVSLATNSKLPLVREFVARRLTEEIERSPDTVDQLVKALGDDSTSAPQKHDILHGMTDALRGWRKAPQPKQWKQASLAFAKSTNDNKRLARELSLVFGDGRAMDELRKIAKDGGVPLEERRSAIRALVLARDQSIVAYLQNLLTNRDLAKDAINGLAAFGNDETPKLLVSKFGGFRDDAKREAINTLVSRVAFATVLLDAVAEQRIARDSVSAFQLRQMQSYGDDTISGRVAKLWPELAEQSREKAERIAQLRKLLSSETRAKADTSNGRLLFSRSCANCHTLFGEGKKIAPDLTGAQRSNLNYLLENIADPSATVSKNFQMRIVLLEDGRVLNGVVLAQNEKTFTVQTATEQVVIQRDEVDLMQDSKLSMMPENLLNVLKDNQIRDLIGYLMSPTQVPLP
ncbi:MAG: putative membrane-bound dehydrogenase-like protein [Planctomycetaceae bacterium]|jgi:putative membrane-bound dehydrogenase-like protein